MIAIPRRALVEMFLAVGICPLFAAEAPKVGPARFYPQTEIVKDGAANCIVVSPATDTDAAQVAERLCQGLQEKYGVPFAKVSDHSVCKERLAPVGKEYLEKNFIAVGNLYTNRVLFPLYAQYLCGSDSFYPGGDGYELRTVANPWGTGRNVIVVGGTTPAGMRAGVEALLRRLPESKNRTAALPYLLDVKPGGEVQTMFAQTAEMLPRWSEPDVRKPYGVETFTLPANRYYWTGDTRWAEVARSYIVRYFNATFQQKYPISHYTMEGMYRAWDMVEESPVFTEEERQATVRNFLETALDDPDSTPRGPVATHVGSTHTSLPMLARWVASRYLRRTFADSPELVRLCDTWEKGVAGYFQGAFKGFRDDTDGGGTGSIAAFMKWSTQAQQYDYFTSNHARVGLHFAVSLNDSLGYGAGLDTYGAARIGSMHSGLSPLFHTQISAFLYEDPEMIWLVLHLPNRSLLLYGQGDSPFRTGSFSIDPGAKEKPPEYLSGFSIIPLGVRRHKKLGAERAMPPEEQCFDKACFRNGFDAKDAYFMLQGVQPEYLDANTIPRYTDKGQVWLAHNSSQIGHYYRNALFLSDGRNKAPLQGACRMDAAGRFETYAMSSTTLCDYFGADWQRVIFWSRGNWFVVLDRATTRKPGFYSAQSVWRMPFSGTWKEDRILVTEQEGKRFYLVAGAPVAATTRFERPTGGPPDIYENPFFLRQRKFGAFKEGDILDFQNLLTTTEDNSPLAYTPIRINDSAVLVRSENGDDVLLGVGGDGREPCGIKADRGIYIADGSSIHVAGVRNLSVDGRTVLDRPEPVTGRIDLKTGAMLSGWDAQQLRTASYTWRLPERASVPLLKEEEARAISHRLAVAMKEVKDVPASVPQEAAPQAVRNPFVLVWENSEIGFDGYHLTGIGMRCSPPGQFEGRTALALDNIIPARAGGVHWNERVPATVELTWPKVEGLREIRLHLNALGALTTAREMSESREVRITWSSDRFRKDLRAEKRTVKSEYRIDPTYKGKVTPQKFLRILGSGVKASGVRLTIPPAGNDPNMRVALHEVEVFVESDGRSGADRRGACAVGHLKAADLDNDGQTEWIVNASDGVLSVIGWDGKMRWQKQFVAEISGLDFGDLDGDGQKEVVCSCYDLNVYAFSAAGELLWKTDFDNLMERSQKRFGISDGSTPFGVGFWDLGNRIRRVLVGSYECQLFVLDERGTILQQYYPGFSMFQRTFAPDSVDLNGDGLKDKLMCSMKYGAFGVIHAIVGNAKGLIAEHRNTSIPDNLPYTVKRIQGKGALAGVITPVGFGLYDIAKNFPKQERSGADTVWEFRGGRPLSAGLLHDVSGDGRDEFFVAGRDGFVSVLSADGKWMENRLIGVEVLDMAAIGAGADTIYLLAAEDGLCVYGADWVLRGKQPGRYTKLTVADPKDRTVGAATDEGRLLLLKLAPGAKDD
ncbi:MAG: VCBS repeat-containing protein [Planctomycetota bacterium]